MTRSNLTRTFLAACSVVALSAAVYGCSGGGGDTPVELKPPLAVDLSGVAAGYTVEAGTYVIEAGATLTVGDVTFTCAAGGAGCTLTVAADGTAVYAAGGGKVTAASSALHGQRSAVEVAVAAAQAAVGALDTMSTDAAIAAAQALIDRAVQAVSDGTLLTDGEKRASSAKITASTTLLEGVTVGARIHAANSAIEGLTAMSTDVDTAAAQAALDAARVALAAVTVLPASEFRALQDRIAAAGRSLQAIKASIARNRTHQGQLSAATEAVEAAASAIGGLTATSTDADVAAAQRALDAAKAAVAAGMLLTEGERDELTGAIALAETSLGSVRTAVADRRTHDGQLSAVDAAVAAAESAVDALDRTSTDAAIASAQALIDAAAQALSDGTLLTEDERSAANTQITGFTTSLEGVTVEARIHAANGAIAGLTAASTDAEIDAAQAAISAATAALRKVQLLTGPQVNAFQGDIDAAKAALAARRTQIADSKTHQEQLTVLDTAVSAAKAAVDALDRMSTDAAIDAAQARIEAAEAAVGAGTKLTVEEKEAASARITTSRTALERLTVEAKVYAAQTAVGGLTVASTEADVDAAQAAIDAASAALRNVRLLSARSTLAFRDSIDAAQAALETVNERIAASRRHGRQLKAVNDAVDAASTAVSGLTADSTEADAADAAGKIQDAKDALAEGTALTAGEKKAATDTITAAEGTLVTRRAAITARRGDAKAMSAALTAAPGTTFDANLSDNLIDGGSVSIAGYEQSTTDTAPAMAGWAGSVYEDVTRDADGRTVIERDTVVVYTDRAASKFARYTTYYAGGAFGAPDTGASAGFSWRRWAGVEAVSDDTNGILDLIEGSAMEAADVEWLFAAGNFGAGQEKLPQRGDNRTYADEDGATDGVQVEIAGSFHGVPGRFTCTGAACTAETTNAGALTLAGDWSFVPGTTNVSVAGAQEDADYLDFGYWSEWDADGGAGGAQAYTVEAFFRGKDPHDAVDIVEGSASYSGKAAGLYARQVYDGNALLDDRTGRFTADVALKAYFGGGAVAPDDQDSISGTITGFMDGDEAIDSGWSVTLNRIQDGGNGQMWNAPDAGAFSGGTTAGGGAAGTWSGAFYGDHEPVNSVTPQPGSVAGEFTARFHNGEVAGAFGARKQ